MLDVPLLDPDPPPEDPARLERESGRTADRLRSLSLVRLAAPLPDGRSRGAAAIALAQAMADRAADLAGRSRQQLPDLPDASAGDAIAVCATDLVEELRGPHADEAVGRVCAEAVAELRALRRLL